jgi:hypothetical protein
MKRTPQAEELWEGVYGLLTRDHPGLVGSLLARSEAHVARLSAIYALLDGCGEIDVQHMKSALAFWDVAEESTKRIFADRTGNKDADRIREAMIPGQRMTLTELRERIFRRHISSGRLNAAIQLLVRQGEFRVEKMNTEGCPATILVRLTAEEMKASDGDLASRAA